MKKYILILGLSFAFLSSSAMAETPDLNAGFYSIASTSVGSGFGYSNRPKRFWNNNSNPFYRRKYGTLTGFSPPVNYGSNNYTAYYNDPYYTYNNSLKTKLKRFFNPNYNNHYLNSPYYNPNLNGNYSNLNNGTRYIPLFNGNNSGVGTGYFNNGFSHDLNTNSSGGAAVTIID